MRSGGDLHKESISEDCSSLASPPRTERGASFSRLGQAIAKKFRGISQHKKDGGAGSRTQRSSLLSPGAPSSPDPYGTPGTSSSTLGNTPEKLSAVKSDLLMSKVLRVPRLELEPNQRDWVVEYYSEKTAEPLTIAEPKMMQNVCIRDNQNVTIIVSKKINNMTIENCTNVSVVAENLIASIELIHCKKCQVQVTGKVPAITVDNSSGINLYLSLESKAAQLTTSQVQEVNLHVPENEENIDNWIELPIPCQFVHHLPEGKNALATRVSDLYH